MSENHLGNLGLEILGPAAAQPVPVQGRPATGRVWRSLDELAETPEFQQFLHREFPEQASEWSQSASRRDFLKLMGASLMLAGVTGCNTRPAERIVPYVDAPEDIIPGKPLYFATAMPMNGYGVGLLVENHMGRPTKVEGNPEHPASLGATNVFHQASILSMYDPQRSQVVRFVDGISTWEQFLSRIGGRMADIRQRGGAGLRILTETVTSPTLAAQLNALLEELPEARWHQYEPVGLDAAREGSRAALGDGIETIYRFDRADVVVSLDSDFLLEMPGSLRYAREFIARRRAFENGDQMSRLYVVESTPSITGSVADHRLPMRTSDIEALARELARQLGVSVADAPSNLTEFQRNWIREVARDLQGQGDQARGSLGRSLVVAGQLQPAAVHALAHAINQQLGSVSTGGDSGTVVHIQAVEARQTGGVQSLRELVDALRNDEVELLVMLGGNPVYNAPADFDFRRILLERRDRTVRVHLSEYYDETSQVCQWHVPAAHYLESWSDARAFDGTATIIQPLINPLYGGKTAHEVVAVLADESGKTSFDLLQDHWQQHFESSGESGEFAEYWRRSLHEGIVPGTAAEGAEPTTAFEDQPSNRPATRDDDLEVVFRPDPTVWDGRFATNAWLQELPKPLTKIVWENCAQISPATAVERGLKSGDVVTLQLNDRVLDNVPIWVMPGHADRSVTVFLGYGRRLPDSMVNDTGAGTSKIESEGYNAYELRTSDAMYVARGLKLTRTGRRHELVTTQNHWSMEGRDIVRFASLDAYNANKDLFKDHHDTSNLPSLYPEYDYSKKPGQNNYKWGMVIDQQSCIGCNACVVACQSENNIPVVGKTEVSRGREMHWLRIDRYYYSAIDEAEDPSQGDSLIAEGDRQDPTAAQNVSLLFNPETVFQPMLCQHCEKAPCEVVCPVAATVHDSEGLSNMIYNRCVGTRYCQNNCPYKVRRFNFLQYSDLITPSLKLMRNPDVTVRNRGIMEKCSFCVQRINTARIEAKIEDRSLRDGEVITACQAACPTRAIVFGDLNDQNSLVHQMNELPIKYSVLGDLNTQPRVNYLGRLMNVNAAVFELERAEYGRVLPEREGPQHDPVGHETGEPH